MKNMAKIPWTAGVVLFLSGCAAPPTMCDLPFPADTLRNGPANIWAYPRNRRVNLDRLASNDFRFTLDDFPDSDPQPNDDDVCWAYCASQVLRYDGVDVSPDELVQKVRERRKGKDLRGDAGTVLDIIRPLFGNRRYIGIYTPNAINMARAITLDSPAVLCLKPVQGGGVGHAVVLTGMRFSFYGQTVLPAEIDVYDPIDGKVSTHDCDEGPDGIWKRIAWCIYFTDFARQ